jgi:hypothetical protein
MRGLLWGGLFCCCLLVAGTAAAQLAQSEIDALRARISSCWSPPPGIDANSRVYVVLRVLFKTDGSISQAPTVVEGTSSALGPALAESAKRALLLCQPFTMLRPEHYEQWKDIQLRFDPHELLVGVEPKIGGRLSQEPNQTPAQAKPPHDYRRLTLKLKPGMSEQDVTKLMGEASQSALTTCGQNTGKPFQCKILSYGFGAGYVGGNGIAVVFGQNESTGEWLVVGWQ